MTALFASRLPWLLVGTFSFQLLASELFDCWGCLSVNIESFLTFQIKHLDATVVLI